MTPAQHVFRLNAASGVPFYRQIIDQVLLAVADGRLPAGAQLPTVRQLAVDLAINLNTVAKAYKEMEIRGIVETHQGTGTFVSARRSEQPSRERRKALQELVDHFISSATARGFSTSEVVDALIERAEKGTGKQK
jgi:GntR family transcriptional regulator